MLGVERLYDKKIDASGLSYFRITYGIVLLCEVLQLFYFRHLIYDKVPFLEPGEIDFTFGLLCWITVIIFLILGLFTRQAAILNYVLTLVFIADVSAYGYHMFYVYIGINFLLIFVNLSKVNSLDRLREKLKYPGSPEWDPSHLASVLNYYIIVGVAIAFVYFDSVLFKTISPIWMKGLGMWLPASVVFMAYTDVTPFLNLKWLVVGMGYLTLAFEAIFIFLFYRKKWRIPLLIIGVGLHLGIAVIFPIPWFGLGVIAIYFLMVPVSFWNRVQNRLSFKEPRLTFYYNGKCAVCLRKVIVLKHFDYLRAISFKDIHTRSLAAQHRFLKEDDILKSTYSVTYGNKLKKGIDTYIYAFRHMPILFWLSCIMSLPGVYQLIKGLTQHIGEPSLSDTLTAAALRVHRIEPETDAFMVFHGISYKRIKVTFITIGIAILILLQINISYRSPLISLILTKVGWSESALDRKLAAVTVPIYHQSIVLLGITRHPVFLDSHFNGYNHVVAVEAVDHLGNRYWLPIINKSGQPGSYNLGFNFVKWTYRVNSVDVNDHDLSRGIRDFSTFWAIRKNLQLDSVKFKVYVKKIKVPVEWEKDVLRKQMAAPWIECGEAYWESNKFISNICNVESL